jgi:hypothetical protein
VRAVAKVNLSAPLHCPRANQLPWRRGCRASAERAKANMVGEATARCSRPVHRGPGDGTHVRTCRVNWGPSPFPPDRAGGLVSESISCRVEGRGADEVIVSDDPAGQHNPQASQGPLDGIVSGSFRLSSPSWESLVRKDHDRRKPSAALAVYKSPCFGSMLAKVTAEFPFEAVLGKTRCTEFQRGRGRHRNPECVYPRRFMDIGIILLQWFAVRPLSTRG